MLGRNRDCINWPIYLLDDKLNFQILEENAKNSNFDFGQKLYFLQWHQALRKIFSPGKSNYVALGLPRPRNKFPLNSKRLSLK